MHLFLYFQQFPRAEYYSYLKCTRLLLGISKSDYPVKILGCSIFFTYIQSSGLYCRVIPSYSVSSGLWLEGFSVRPKFGIGYGIGRKYRYWSRNFFFRNQNFFFKFYSFFPNSWGNTSFYKLENKPSTQPFKNNLKVSNVWRKIWFQGPFYDGKNTSGYL